MLDSLLIYFLLLITQFSDIQDIESPAKVPAGAYALVNATVIDGTSDMPSYDQTVLIEEGLIKAIGTQIVVPDNYQVMDMSGRTIIPGIVGTHNHMRLPQGPMFRTSPRLYLACGVTTIQTCGTGNPHEELAIARAIEEGKMSGPRIIPSTPYFTGPEGKDFFIRAINKQVIRDTLAYWASQGAQWVKVYRNTRPEDLKAIVEEAHALNLKVTGHLCATTFEEAARLGIDAIEHGFIHAYDFASGYVTGACGGGTGFRSALDIKSEKVQDLIQLLIRENVSLSSTPAIFETQTSGSRADQRTLKAMAPFHVSAYKETLERKKAKMDDWYFREEWLSKSLEFDLAFYRAGGLLTAGPDPGLHNLPGFGDQRTYQLLEGAGFLPEEAIQVMTSNGAKRLGLDDTGVIMPGKRADLVILTGDLTSDPAVIMNTAAVMKNGAWYDPAMLLEPVWGMTGGEEDGIPEL